MPHLIPDRESRQMRLLKLLLLQIAILSFTNACGASHTESQSETQNGAPPAQPAPRPRFVDGRFIPTDLTESLDRMSTRSAQARTPLDIANFAIDRRTSGEVFVEHTATSALDTGRLAEAWR